MTNITNENHDSDSDSDDSYLENYYRNNIGVDLSKKELTTLPEIYMLSTEMLLLNISTNNIEEIYTLPETLTSFKCDKNQLQYLPNLPLNLEYLDFSENNITKIPNLPSGLTYLDRRDVKTDDIVGGFYNTVIHSKLRKVPF